MANFLKPKQLKSEIINLFREADDFIFIVSPYIKLPAGLKEMLLDKQNDESFGVIVLYGKNPANVSKSLSEEDLNFFKAFQNVDILYNEHLHAKFYANEKQSITTSLNLHDYSIENNIEVGVQFKTKRFSLMNDNELDAEASNYFFDLLDHSKVIFEKHVRQKKYFFGLLSKSDGTEIVEDRTDKYYKTEKKDTKPEKVGYCIRTGTKIPFNIKMPYSDKAFESWKRYENKAYKEKYCHFSGEETNGATSFEKPILAKHWKKATA